MNCESGLGYHYRNWRWYLPQGKQFRTRTLKRLPGITAYKVGKAVPKHTRCTLLTSKEHIIIGIHGLLYVV